ncbi:hypothetical protein [Halorubrum yunnanense]|uniref:Uncharacterized protein n=1 Tax=Halorubrum yunnanense TaxID=1526162 RepID=A0ABD5YCB4_9EURY|nr:hypothetical protein [Halorubrum yunnanense]
MIGVALGAAGIAAVTALLALSAFFSSSETAIFSLPAPFSRLIAAEVGLSPAAAERSP